MVPVSYSTYRAAMDTPEHLCTVTKGVAIMTTKRVPRIAHTHWQGAPAAVRKQNQTVKQACANTHEQIEYK